MKWIYNNFLSANICDVHYYYYSQSVKTVVLEIGSWIYQKSENEFTEGSISFIQSYDMG